MKANLRSSSHLITAALASLLIASMPAKAADFFVTKKETVAFLAEQDCALFIAARAKNDGSSDLMLFKAGVIPAGSELTVENVGINGVDKFKLKGYPIDLFAPNLLGFPTSH